MKVRQVLFAVLAAASAFGTGGAGANTVPGDIVSGNLSALNGHVSLAIEGHTYRLKDGTAAIAAAAHLTPGQSVTLQLDGPAASPASQVINVVPNTGR